MNLAEHIELVKSQIRYHKGLLTKRPADRVNRDKHISLINQWEALVEDLQEAADFLGHELPHQPSTDNGTGDSADEDAAYGDLSDLPRELLQELGLTESDLLENQIIEVYRNAGRPLAINDVLIGLYRTFGVIQKRKPISSRLYRMVKKGQLESLPDRKGVYRLSQSA